MTATTTLPAIPAVSGSQRDGDCIVLRDISWERYLELRDDPAQMRVRMTFHNGVLELMSPSGPHERINRLLEGLLRAWCEGQNISLASFGSTTYRLEKSKAGLEPDSCYYIEHAAEMRNREEVDLSIDPPPDLAIEVDIRASSLGRLPIYASLGVPEVWRTNGEWLKIYRLEEAAYVEVPASLSLPGFSSTAVMQFLERRNEDEISLIREFRTWAAAQTPSAGSDS